MRPKQRIQKTALAVTHWIGSPASVIVHTLLFIACFVAVEVDLIEFTQMLLVLTTIVSLEAIYLSIFIQMTINYTTQSIEEVEKDIDEIQKDVDEIQEDVGELQEDVEDISEDVEEMSEEEQAEEHRKVEQKQTLATIQNDLRKLMADIERLQKSQLPPTI